MEDYYRDEFLSYWKNVKTLLKRYITIDEAWEIWCAALDAKKEKKETNKINMDSKINAEEIDYAMKHAFDGENSDSLNRRYLSVMMAAYIEAINVLQQINVNADNIPDNIKERMIIVLEKFPKEKERIR